MDALVAVDRRSRAGLALQVEDLGAIGEGIDDGLGFRLAALDIVGTDVGENALDAIDTAVDRHDGDASLDGLLDRRRQSVDVERRDDDGIDFLHERGLDIRGLLGRRVLAVAFDDVDALRLCLSLDLVEHVDEEREAEVRDRSQDRQLFLCENAGGHRGKGSESYGRLKKFASIHKAHPPQKSAGRLQLLTATGRGGELMNGVGKAQYR